MNVFIYLICILSIYLSFPEGTYTIYLSILLFLLYDTSHRIIVLLLFCRTTIAMLIRLLL
ncbi:uncharacterized protein BX663DRAFT_526890 [Cokeromyces recurvatus]|uniref:uncharacterized protein n=1 Tax=Cokeromyces recurvatus TaxID=90255 RepID=UPI00221F9271|nr:uncharacterized protein BX663DRAFT_526890 [Cokeromyces recurvatus]KAI7897911.1 hypothetical protein BX663DRAFT_526890 [Cokeromyces recurvatus]